MKLFNLDFTTLILRFYLLMGVVILSFFTGYPILSFLALPIFMSAMMGISFARTKSVVKAATQRTLTTRSPQHQSAH